MREKSLRGSDKNTLAKITISKHEDLGTVAEKVHEHLEAYPQNAILFMVDILSATKDIGIEMSEELQQHLVKALRKAKLCGKPRPNLYRQLKENKSVPPMEVALTLRPMGKRGDAPPKAYSIVQQPRTLNFKQLQSTSHQIPIAESQGFSVLVQLTEDAVNKIVAEAFRSEQIKHVWENRSQLELPFNIVIAYGYTITLQEVKVVFAYDSDDSVQVNISATTVMFIEQADKEGRIDFKVDLSVSIGASVKIDKSSRPNMYAVFINLRKIDNLVIQVEHSDLPPPVLWLIERVLEKEVREQLEKQNEIPLSFDIEAAERGGVPIKAVKSKIVKGQNNEGGSLTLALDTTGFGRIDLVRHIVPRDQDFAFITTRTFLIDQVWALQSKSKFPIKDGKLEIHSPYLDLGDGFIFTRIELSYEAFDECIGSWHIDAKVAIWSAFESFQRGDIWYLKPVARKTDIELDEWDEFIIETILGAILFVLGINNPITRSIITKIIVMAIIGIAEEKLSDEIGGFNFGIFADIPGTKRRVLSSTPVIPYIKSEGISIAGSINFVDSD